MASKGKRTGSPFEALRSMKEALEKKEATEKASGARGPSPKRAAPAPSPASPATPEDDAMVMHRLFAGVTPLDRKPARVAGPVVGRSESIEQQARRGAEAAEVEAQSVRDHLRRLVEGDARFEVSDDGRRVEGRRVELRPDLLRKLRHGQWPIDARLDLHGQSASEARETLERFLATCRAHGERCVLVVHGKGEHSPARSAVLRGEIAAWLSQGGASQHVGAFATALPGDGGEGAVYVLLR